MQEHIRRAHPNHYIPKLPATEESFLLMVNTPPEQRAQLSPPEPARPRRPHGHGQFCAPLCRSSFSCPSPRKQGFANGQSQIWRIETSMSLIPAPRPPLELSMKPTPPLRPRPLLSHNCTTTVWPPTGTLIWYVLLFPFFPLWISLRVSILR